MTADEAKPYFEQLNPKSGELDDDALDGVVGGCGANDEPPMYACPYCGTANVLDWALGDTGVVECCTGCGKNFTVNYGAQVK